MRKYPTASCCISLSVDTSSDSASVQLASISAHLCNHHQHQGEARNGMVRQGSQAVRQPSCPRAQYPCRPFTEPHTYTRGNCETDPYTFSIFVFILAKSSSAWLSSYPCLPSLPSLPSVPFLAMPCLALPCLVLSRVESLLLHYFSMRLLDAFSI